jgi:hypothetical protein
LSSASSSANRIAEDVIKGAAAHTISGGGLSVSQIKPKGLSLFELAILANVIHEEDPNYFVLSRQCYWFVAIMFRVVESIWGDQLNEERAGLLPGQYLPKGGSWKKLHIVPELKDEDILRVKTIFEKRRDIEFSAVSF